MQIAHEGDRPGTTAVAPRDRELVRGGFLAMLPLWTGAIPTGIAYAVAAHDAGLSRFETQVMSLTVFSAAAQLGAVGLLGDGASLMALATVAFALNIHLLLLGLATARAEPLSRTRQALVAFFLTDGAFGIAARWERIHWQVLLGAGLSMYLGWNIGTLAGALAGPTLESIGGSYLALVAPLSFVAVLAPLVRTSAAVAAMLVAGLLAALLTSLPAGVALLIAALAGSVVGSLRADHVHRQARRT